MEQLGNELKKVLKAGMGAVATGLEMGQDAIEQLAKKGEPLYEQAKCAVADAAGKVKQTIDSLNVQPQAQEIIDTLRGMGKEAWDQVRAALDEFETQAAEAEKATREASEAAEEILRSVRKDVDAFVDGAMQFDDLTMLCFVYKGGASS